MRLRNRVITFTQFRTCLTTTLCRILDYRMDALTSMVPGNESYQYYAGVYDQWCRYHGETDENIKRNTALQMLESLDTAVPEVVEERPGAEASYMVVLTIRDKNKVIQWACTFRTMARNPMEAEEREPRSNFASTRTSVSTGVFTA